MGAKDARYKIILYNIPVVDYYIVNVYRCDVNRRMFDGRFSTEFVKKKKDK